MKSILKKISSFISTPVTEFNIVRFRYNDRTEIEYNLKGFLFWDSYSFNNFKKINEKHC